MKRVLFCGLLVGSLILMEASSTPMADEKRPGWQTKDDVKVFDLSKVPEIGITSPECVMMRIPKDKLKDLEQEPLEFLQKRKIFEKAEQVQGHAVLRLVPLEYKVVDEDVVFACHDD